MKKSAKLLSAVMAGAMVLSMAGCGSSSNSTETTAAAAETTAAAADSSAAESKEATSNTDATVIKLGTTVNEQDSFQVFLFCFLCRPFQRNGIKRRSCLWEQY